MEIIVMDSTIPDERFQSGERIPGDKALAWPPTTTQWRWTDDLVEDVRRIAPVNVASLEDANIQQWTCFGWNADDIINKINGLTTKNSSYTSTNPKCEP